jgi:hypothetical protein
VAADPLPVDPVLLAKTARRLFNEDDLRPSVVMAQAAIDVATERTLVAAFAARGVPELTESVLSLFKGGFSLAKGGLYGVYQALTRDGLKQDTQLWGKFREHVLRRNAIVHAGKKISEADAERSVRVAEEMLQHLEKVAQRLQASRTRTF